jgi:hypothetical protein
VQFQEINKYITTYNIKQYNDEESGNSDVIPMHKDTLDEDVSVTLVKATLT